MTADVPILAGVTDEPRSPVLNTRRANITRPLRVPADYRGPWGRAWRVNLSLARSRQTRIAAPDSMVSHWIVEAPWSSEVVHSYSLVLIHLRFSMLHRPATQYLPGATHEMALWAINPQTEREPLLTNPVDPRMWLHPAVFASQLVAASDAAAERAVFRAIELVCDGRLSPHPTWGKAWAEIFGDNMLSVARSGVAPREPAEEETT